MPNLYEKFDTLNEVGAIPKEIPDFVKNNIRESFTIRPYQIEAFSRFFYYFSGYPQKSVPIHLLFNMATWSWKTFIMAWIILYLYEKGYRNFLFFVNSKNIIEKTKDNFLNDASNKYLFWKEIRLGDKTVHIKEVDNFTSNNKEDIQIKFTTIQGLHMDLNNPKENSITYEDFDDNEVVIISDEAHHINSLTKSKLNTSEKQEKNSWEYTVLKILNKNIRNLLLEFTATIDDKNQNIAEKYAEKILYKYDLKQFRLDGYSKEVDLVKTDLSQKERVLQAVILSQYRLKVAENNKISCKPVILFKAQKEIKESKENELFFNDIIKNLKVSDLEKVKNDTNVDIVIEAFKYFEENNIKLELLVDELKNDFAPEKCLNVNEENVEKKSIKKQDKEEVISQQYILNSLEDKNNRIRAIFAVQKLNEWWDVLNLFDIVRMYDSRSNVVDKRSWKIVPWPQTISEAQLIGRWARYYPFTYENFTWEEKYKRKFDGTDNELKILETFYYHTSFNSEYISEIKEALRNTGMIDESDKIPFTVKVKEDNKISTFLKNSVIYVNSRIEVNTWDYKSFQKYWITQKSFDYNIYTGRWWTEVLFEDTKSKQNENIDLGIIDTIKVSEIDKVIVLKALHKNRFYKFSNLKKYFWALESIDNFIQEEWLLWGVEITFRWDKNKVEIIDRESFLNAIINVLVKLEKEIASQNTEYKWTKEFKEKSLAEVFETKVIQIDWSKRVIEKNTDYFTFNEIVATSEEEDFLSLFEIEFEKLKEKYDDIYLFRNERHFAIYSFDDGGRFEPDFVLFMKEKWKEEAITYQVFIEPKWNEFKDAQWWFENWKEWWKQKFLLNIEDEAEIIDLNLWKYHLIGLPFYNKDLEVDFKNTFNNKFN